MDIKLNPQSAASADVIISRITDSGAYLGTITKAELITSQKGNFGLELSFKAKDGATADYLQMWIAKPNGEELVGMKQFHALMACLKLREVKEGEIKAKKYSQEESKMVDATMRGYPEMMGKTIGLILQRELYTKKTGAEGERMLIVSFYDENGFTASEVIGKATKPAQVESALAWLAKKPVKDSRTGQATPNFEADPFAKAAGDAFADDIPF